LLSRTRENIVASFIDVGSIFIAYQIGISQMGLLTGLVYGVFDAWIVVWQRERISNYVQSAENLVRKVGPLRRRDILPWASD